MKLFLSIRSINVSEGSEKPYSEKMKNELPALGFRFTAYQASKQTPFERLFEIFKELITHTSGDFDEAIEWLRELDKEYQLTDENYTIDDFINDLLEKSYIRTQKLGRGLAME